jgi:hypothetical protein
MVQRMACVALVTMTLAGCMHLRGAVVEDPSGKPLPTARFTVGRPDGIAVYETHDVDRSGLFDFYVGPMDTNAIYVYDRGSGVQSMRRIDREEMSDNMKIRIRRGSQEMPPGFGVTP